MMLSAVCISQVTKFCRVAPEYGVCFCYISGNGILRFLIDFWKICSPTI